jgi:S1-C subfamily serine protease
MIQPVTIHFVDPNGGECSATVRPSGCAVAITFSIASNPSASNSNVEMVVPAATAARLADAILAAAGERTRPQLPRSRQIGGIIGPY